MTTYYKATFSNGVTLKRSTASRKYSHAFLVRGDDTDPTKSVWKYSGFCGTERLARKQINVQWAHFAEIAPAIEITRKEYLELA